MPAPNPFTGLTLTQATAGSPLLTLAAAHDGANLDRIEILRRRTGTTTWERVRLSPIGDFTATAGVNMFTADQASIEASAATWLVNANCTLARTTTDALFGAASLLMTSTANGTASFGCWDDPVLGIVPTTTYTVSVYPKAVANPRDIGIRIDWLNAANGFISQTAQTPVTAETTAWGPRLSRTALAPALAAKAQVSVWVSATTIGEEHRFDGFQFEAAATPSSFALPGTTYSTTVVSSEGYDFAIRALSAAGEVST